MTAPTFIPLPQVERVDEGSDYHVEVTLPAPAVLPALLQALGANGFLLAQASRFRHAPSPESRDEALQILANDQGVQAALRLRLSSSNALHLRLNLEYAGAVQQSA